MQIMASDGYDDHDPDGSFALTVVPGVNEVQETNGTNHSSSEPLEEGAESVTIPALIASIDPLQTPISILFSAVSSCANLHPDPQSPGSSGPTSPDQRFGGIGDSADSAYQVLPDGLPPPMPGSGGWITAENMHEHFDENGVPRTGRVRAREDHEDSQDDLVRNDGEESKWRRTQ